MKEYDPHGLRLPIKIDSFLILLFFVIMRALNQVLLKVRLIPKMTREWIASFRHIWKMITLPMKGMSMLNWGAVGVTI